MNKYYDDLRKKIEDRSAKIAVVGLGYVGLPHAIHYADSNFSVIGLDKDKQKVELLKKGQSYIDDISNEAIQQYLQRNEVIDNYQSIQDADVIFIDVPTPIDEYQNPDLTALEESITNILDQLVPGKLIILESTSYPTTTVKYIVEPLLNRDFEPGEDVFVAFSPERIDPGNKHYSVKDTPKLVGGYTQKCTELATKMIGETAVPVASPEVAELAKLYENTFRFVNIGLADELSKVCRTLNINTRDVLDAAETKPFGFMRFNPTVKIGGHCIGVDPYYLHWFMEKEKINSALIEATGKVDQSMLQLCMDRIMDILSENRIPVFQSKIALLGVTYKKNSSDTRLSAVPELLEKLEKYQASVDLYDDFATTIQIGKEDRAVQSLQYKDLSDYDLVVVLVDHDAVDYLQVLKHSRHMLDTKYLFSAPFAENYYYL
ncbi:UDP-N-acetyl-D-glucosamine dehydrogenase [Enterococcus sp. AZ135]|uniref:nucleotide sugar dehydrogenase n=1 Tax=unclassified Enterococcus TaxID=2608891 RepID=UPI003F21600A